MAKTHGKMKEKNLLSQTKIEILSLSHLITRETTRVSSF